MWWFVVYLALLAFHCVACWKWIPREQIRVYKASPKPWDYWLAGILYYSVPITGLLQSRLSPNDRGIIWRLGGVVLFLLGSAAWIMARQDNPYFLPVTVRPPTVITTGIYQRLNHPGYIGIGLSAFSVMQVLSSEWALVPMVLYWGVLFQRAVQEDKLLGRV